MFLQNKRQNFEGNRRIWRIKLLDDSMNLPHVLIYKNDVVVSQVPEALQRYTVVGGKDVDFALQGS
jgi:hypothetical protein